MLDDAERNVFRRPAAQITVSHSEAGRVEEPERRMMTKKQGSARFLAVEPVQRPSSVEAKPITVSNIFVDDDEDLTKYSNLLRRQLSEKGMIDKEDVAIKASVGDASTEVENSQNGNLISFDAAWVEQYSRRKSFVGNRAVQKDGFSVPSALATLAQSVPGQRTPRELEAIGEVLGDLDFFDLLEDEGEVELCHQLYQHLQVGRLEKLGYLAATGVMMSEFFVIYSGKCDVRFEHQLSGDQTFTIIRTLTTGDYFGETYLVRNTASKVSVLASTDVMVLCLSKALFTSLLSSFFAARMEKTVDILMQHGLFKLLDPTDFIWIADLCFSQTLPLNTIVLRQGEYVNRLFVVYLGECRLIRQLPSSAKGRPVAVELRRVCGSGIAGDCNGDLPCTSPYAIITSMPTRIIVVPTVLLAHGRCPEASILEELSGLWRSLLSDGELEQACRAKKNWDTYCVDERSDVLYAKLQRQSLAKFHHLSSS